MFVSERGWSLLIPGNKTLVLNYPGSKWWWLHALLPIPRVEPRDRYFEISRWNHWPDPTGLHDLDRPTQGSNSDGPSQSNSVQFWLLKAWKLTVLKCWIKMRNQIKIISNTSCRRKKIADRMQRLLFTNHKHPKLRQLWPIWIRQNSRDFDMIY